jgi:trk system potassium uptake protein TrkA
LGERRRDEDERKDVLVIGLGRFGSSLAQTLIEMGHRVLAIDSSPQLVQRYAADLTHVVEG